MPSKKLVELLKARAVRTGNFVLSSGKKSSYYIDLKKAYTNPEILRELTKEMAKLIKREETDKIAGIAVGAIPLATGLSLDLNIPFLIIRKGKKEYGTKGRIEGEIKAGERVIVVEDVTTTGSSALSAVEAIREKKLICNKVIVAVDRLEGAEALLKKHDITLTPLITKKDLF